MDKDKLFSALTKLFYDDLGLPKINQFYTSEDSWGNFDDVFSDGHRQGQFDLATAVLNLVENFG